MNDEQARVWFEALLAYSKYYPAIWLEVLGENHEHI
jgi:hypothetical protein